MKLSVSASLCAALLAVSRSVLAEPGVPPIFPSIKGNLVALQGKSMRRFDDAPLASTRYFAVYYSAAWCGPCREFTPKLAAWYADFKPKHPEFEVIFVSRDEDETAMENYMKSDRMPWPALRFPKIAKHAGFAALAGKGIPCLVFVDADGKVLSHSYVGERYVGPSKVMSDIEKTLGSSVPDAAGSASPQPATSGSAYRPAGSTFDDFFKR